VSENTTYNANGNYTATVLAVSLVGNASTQIGITVSGGNTSRGWLNAYASPTYGSAPLNVTFWGNDSAGIAPTWSFGAGNATNSTTAVGWVVSFVYTSPGLYLATATVNASGTPLVWSTWINVTSATPPPPPPPPAPNVTGILIAAAVGIGGNPLAVQFVVIGSMNWSELANASWTFGDGASATGAFLNYTYPGAGFYQVNVSVSIGGGHADTASVWLAVGSGGSSGNGSNGSGSGGGSGGSGGNGGGSGGPGGNGSGNQSGNNSGGNTSNPRDPHTSGGPGTSVNDAGYAIAGLGPLGSVLVYLGLGICAGLVGTHLIRERRKGGRPN
jgi:PKD repeat protein